MVFDVLDLSQSHALSVFTFELSLRLGSDAHASGKSPMECYLLCLLNHSLCFFLINTKLK